MAEEVAQPLTYVPEIILKKRKSNEELALRRKEQLVQRKFQLNKNKQEYIKKPEDFVKEFRYSLQGGGSCPKETQIKKKEASRHLTPSFFWSFTYGSKVTCILLLGRTYTA